MWKRLFPKGFLHAAQMKQVVCHVCLRACITSWGKEPLLRPQRFRGQRKLGPLFLTRPWLLLAHPNREQSRNAQEVGLGHAKERPGVAEEFTLT